MDDTAVESVHHTDLDPTKSPKCPKPFSIESLISSDTDKHTHFDATPTSKKSANPNTNVPSPALFFPANASMAAAATIYSPWFHNYFLQQQKLSENVIDMMHMGAMNGPGVKDKFPEMFVNSAMLAEQQRSPLQTFDADRSGAPQQPAAAQLPSAILPNNGCGGEMLLSPESNYYKHLSSYGSLLAQYNDRLEQCRSDMQHSGDEHGPSMHDPSKFGGIVGEYNISVRNNDDSGPDDANEDDLDSDCNSEISMNMSPDGDHANQGIYNLLLSSICLLVIQATIDWVGWADSVCDHKCHIELSLAESPKNFCCPIDSLLADIWRD